MTQSVAPENVMERLAAALASDRFPGEARLQGANLLTRLKTPVQVVVIGRTGSGKSRLIRMLLGQPIPEPSDATQTGFPAVEFSFGPQARQRLVYPDDRTEDHDGRTEPPDDAVLLRVELPVPLLNRVTLTEVPLRGSTEAMRASADWACQRADIVLWCTQGFDAIERMLWADAPDTLKDHSFLVLTKADRLLMKGQLKDRISSLSAIVAQEFHSLFPVATIQAISAASPADDVWTASGGRVLHDAVFRLVDTGRRADTDNALLFLSRYAAALSQSGSRPVPVAAPVERDQSDGADPAPIAGQHRRTILAEAMSYLEERADLLLRDLDAHSDADGARVLTHCLETANTLSDLLEDFAHEDPGLIGLQDDIQESADLMLLLQLEDSADAASDAVTLLQQLKRDMADHGVA